MTYRLQNMMLAMLLALTTLFVGIGTLSQNPTSGGYQLFERAASGISADIQLASLGNFAPSPETASEYANAPNRTDGFMSGGSIRSGDVTVQYEGNVIALGDGAETTGNFGRAPDFGGDVQTVVVHGNPDGTFSINERTATATEVADLIQSAPNYNPDSTIFLGSCRSGFCMPEVGTSGAQEIANIMGQPVIAPTVRTAVPTGGSNWVLDINDRYGIQPDWHTFVPE